MRMTSTLGGLAALVLLVACGATPPGADLIARARPTATPKAPAPFPVLDDMPRQAISLRGGPIASELVIELARPLRHTRWKLTVAKHPDTSTLVVRVPASAQLDTLTVEATDGKRAPARSPVATGAAATTPRGAPNEVTIVLPPSATDEIVTIGYTDTFVATSAPLVEGSTLPGGPLVVHVDEKGARTSTSFAAGETRRDLFASPMPPRPLAFAGAGGEGTFDVTLERAARSGAGDAVAILVDTSAAAAPFRGRAMRWLEAVLRALPASTSVTIATFDHATQIAARGRASEMDGASVGPIAQREAMGLARWAHALRSVPGDAPGSGATRVIAIGAPGTRAFDLREEESDALARDLVSRGVRRLDVVSLGGDAPPAWLAPLLRAGEGGFSFDGRETPKLAVAALFQAPAVASPITTSCASIDPARVDDLRAAPHQTIAARGCDAATAPKLAIAGRELVAETTPATSAAPGATFLRGEVYLARAPSNAAPSREVTFVVDARPMAKAAGGGLSTTPALWDPLVAFEEKATAPAPPQAEEAPPPRPEPAAEEPVTVVGKLPPETIRRIVRLNAGRFKGCYREALLKKRGARGTVVTSFRIGSDGTVSDARVVGGDFPLEWMRACVTRSFAALSFPAPPDGFVEVKYGLAFDDEGGGGGPAKLATASRAAPEAPVGPAEPSPPADGELRAIQDASRRDPRGAVAQALALRAKDPSPFHALVLGDAARTWNMDLAERAYATPFAEDGVQPDAMRLFGARLRAVETDDAKRLGLGALMRAAELAPEEPNGALLSALAYLADQKLDRAADVLEKAIAARGDASRGAADRPASTEADATLVDLYALVLSAWSEREPWRKDEHRNLLATLDTELRKADALRVLAFWEGPGIDVDLEVIDGAGSHAVPGHAVAQGGELRTDARSGLAPEVFGADGPAEARLGPFRVQVRTNDLPAPFVAGTVVVVERVGKRFAVTFHPFAMNVAFARADVTTVESTALTR